MKHKAERYLLAIVAVYPSWLAMMVVHESGHVFHAWLSGGHVSTVHFGFFEFSRTELSSDPHPQFVAWGGPIWGCLIPLLASGLATQLRSIRFYRLSGFFAGFCLIANGGYIGVGWTIGAGDAGTLLRHGVSPWAMSLFGLAAAVGGLYLWHRLGSVHPGGSQLNRSHTRLKNFFNKIHILHFYLQPAFPSLTLPPCPVKPMCGR